MKYLFISLILVFFITCNSINQDNLNKKQALLAIPVSIPKTLENRRKEFQSYVEAARNNINAFAKKYEWQNLTKDDFIDSVMIFDNKNKFNITLLKLAEADTLTELPQTYCAALEKRTLVAVSPEYYANVYPAGVESRYYEKLLTHEIAHRLHVRILNGHEEEMGPIWFYEGFAIFVAGQFSNSVINLNKEEMTDVMKDSVRGSYEKYSFIFRYFLKKVSLKELIIKAKDENFNDWLIAKINGNPSFNKTQKLFSFSPSQNRRNSLFFQ
jgi:hypothetical protein